VEQHDEARAVVSERRDCNGTIYVILVTLIYCSCLLYYAILSSNFKIEELSVTSKVELDR
jgi:hypothetical protein